MQTRTVRLALIFSLLIGLLAVAPVGGAEPTITVVVQPGDSLVTYLWTYGVSGSRMAALNKLADPNLIYPGQKLLVPVSLGTTPYANYPFNYVAKTGDTQDTVVSTFYIDAFWFRWVNDLSTGEALTPGKTYLIPPGPHRYKIVKGDTVKGIAAMFAVSSSQLLADNPQLGDGSLLAVGTSVFIRRQVDVTTPAIFTPGAPAVGDVGGGGAVTATPTPTATSSVPDGVNSLPVPNPGGTLKIEGVAMEGVVLNPAGDHEKSVWVTIRVWWSGGKSPYRLFHDGAEQLAFRFKVAARCDFSIVHTVALSSSDGQNTNFVYYFSKVPCP